MNFNEYENKSVLVLGKTRSLTLSEFEALLKLHKITLSSDTLENASLLVEGRMMNPYEQSLGEQWYQEKRGDIVSIDAVEEWLCGSIDGNRLLMSLKLSKDQERLVTFIQNPYISEELFFKLLKLYDWQKEGLFDNDRNRDVTAAIIGRFYKDLNRNHNVQYAMSGLAHLIERYGTAELIGAIGDLTPVSRALQGESERSMELILDSMALHPLTPERILQRMVKGRPLLLARRNPPALENDLLSLKDDRVNQTLARNPALSPAGIEYLRNDYGKLLAGSIVLTREYFEEWKDCYAESLAQNKTLQVWMQEALLSIDDQKVNTILASNPTANQEILEALKKNGGYGSALASNPSLVAEDLEFLYQIADAPVLEALASNPSTPVEILYQLALDKRFESKVKANPGYGQHIQTHNIGWL